ncbi:hypothetical protein ACFYTF_12005 [Nocardia thailandica]|uniref:Uncharacterized protein n=1 Tax=Nocardia thailandica TaxID=257275 RepID=A0ABW6PMB8_9NOCA
MEVEVDGRGAEGGGLGAEDAERGDGAEAVVGAEAQAGRGGGGRPSESGGEAALLQPAVVGAVGVEDVGAVVGDVGRGGGAAAAAEGVVGFVEADGDGRSRRRRWRR